MFSFESSPFKKEHSFENRKEEAQRIIAKYPDRVPVICEKASRSGIPDIDKKKYLVPADLTIGNFICVIRKRMKLDNDKAIYLFINNIQPPTNTVIGDLYNDKKDKDCFLYIKYSAESTFGATHSGTNFYK